MSKKNNEQKEINKDSFFYKYKNDKKYNAKVQLIGYSILIGVLIIFANISNINNNHSNNNLTNTTNKTNEMSEENLLEKIDNNYAYDITISVTNTTDENLNYHYYGKSYNNTLEINKEVNNINNIYYKVDDYYYKQGQNDYILATTEEVYDLVPNNYIEINKVLEYIKKSSLDHITNYSNGKKESLYNLYLKDIIINNKTEETITINIEEENDTLIINIDYTNLIKEMINTIKECKISYTYTNIDKLEEFFTLEVQEPGDENE